MSEENEERLAQLAEEYRIGKDMESDEQIKLLSQLDRYPQEQLISILNYFVSHEKNPNTLLYLVKTLGKYRDISSTSVLIELLLLKDNFKENLTNPDEYLKVRCMSAVVLGNIKQNSAVMPLLYILNNKDENYKLRLGAAEALGRIGDKYAVAPLIDLVTDENEKSVYIRESAAKALGMLGDIRALDPLIGILETKKGIIDKFTFLKERIIEAIGKLGFRDDKAIKVLSSALMDESSCIRLEAIEALSEIEDDRILPLIEKMVYDEEEDVARGAITALYNIEGENYLINLLKRENLPGWCRDEIEMTLDEEEDE